MLKFNKPKLESILAAIILWLQFNELVESIGVAEIYSHAKMAIDIEFPSNALNWL